MRTLYPEIEPLRQRHAAGRRRHTLYYEQCGNPQGKPVVLLHGGPGAGCSAKMRRFHDPAKYRIVLFDQRGSGRSTPHADLVDNTTWDLVADIETPAREAGHRALAGVRRQLGFDAGAGLCARPIRERVTELVLRGIFMLRRWELEWFYQEGASRLFPDAWEHYLARDPAGRAPRPDRRLPPSADLRRRGHAPGGGARVERLGRRDQLPARGSGFRQRPRGRRVRAGLRAHREPLLRQRRLLRGRGPVAARRAPHRRHPRRDRAWPLRRGLPDRERLGTAQGLAEGGAGDLADVGAFGVRGGEHRRAGARRPIASP